MAKATNPRPAVVKKDGELQANGVLIQNISIRPVQRTNLDIDKWRKAHQEAEAINGRRISLYDLYDDVLLDGFLRRLVARRIGGVTTNRLQYTNEAGKKIDEADSLLTSLAFRRLRQHIQAQKAWGIAVIELANVAGKLHLFDVPKKHIRPAEGKIVTEQYSEEGIEYRQSPYTHTVLEVGEFGDLGYLLQAAAYVIYKRGGVADWANFAQIFGMPFREARYDGFNEQVRIQLEQAMEKAGSAAYAVLPKEAELTFHESKNTNSSADLYNKLRQAMNEELMVLILGATETTTSSQSSGYAQSETHAKTVSEVMHDDREEELAILNEQVLPILQYLGLLPANGRFVYDDAIDLDEAGKQVDVAIKLKNAGVPVDDDWFYLTTGIPKPDNYDELKAEYEAKKANEQAALSPEPAKGPKGSSKGEGKKLALDETRLAAAPSDHADEEGLSSINNKLTALQQRMDDFFGQALD